MAYHLLGGSLQGGLPARQPLVPQRLGPAAPTIGNRLPGSALYHP